MDRRFLNYAIDIGLLVTFLLVFTTGLIKFPALTMSFNFVYQVIPHLTLNAIHDWSGLLMGILVLAHLAIHWRWLVEMTKNYLGRSRNVTG